MARRGRAERREEVRERGFNFLGLAGGEFAISIFLTLSLRRKGGGFRGGRMRKGVFSNNALGEKAHGK